MKHTDKKLNIKEDAQVTQALHRFTEARKKKATDCCLKCYQTEMFIEPMQVKENFHSPWCITIHVKISETNVVSLEGEAELKASQHIVGKEIVYFSPSLHRYL